MESQHELFGDLPRKETERVKIENFRLPGGKIVQVPYSVWKDGRKRLDLTQLGGSVITSRNPEIADQQAREELRKIFESRDEMIREHDERAIEVVHKLLDCNRRPSKQRLRKEDLPEVLALQPATGLIYANPLANDKSQFFGKYPDWLLERKDLEDQEKLIYGRLLFPLPPICKNFYPNSGVIIGLNQAKLGESLGRSRSWANRWLIELQAKLWLECTGEPGAKQAVRFFWKEGMPETCHTVAQVSAAEPVPVRDSMCAASAQQPVPRPGSTCATSKQVSQAVEKREIRREKRERSPSPWYSKAQHGGPE